ncbi:unnamed protein product [Rhodiola kirilowii]
MRKNFEIWLAMLMLLAMLASLSESKCEFQAIFNFGDSNSDTGGFWAAFPAQSGPFGMTYFKRPAGRATDGRLIVDFLAQALGIPFLSPYLQSIGSDFRHGANFATLASTVLYPQTSLYVSGLSPFSLGIQLRQLKEFKVKVDQLSSSGSSYLPPRDIFGKSLYTFYIGQNDFTSQLNDIGVGGVQEILPAVVYEIGKTVKEIYGIGGRTFWILNMAPVGCYPSFLVQLMHHHSSDLDQYGCLKPINDAVAKYNEMLKNKLAETRQDLPDASVILVDVYSLMLELFKHPKKHGLWNGVKACCGYGGGKYNYNQQVYCGNSNMIDGKNITATACEDPYHYVSWDGIHATEVANKLVTAAILNGSSFHPYFPLSQRCDLQPIG